MNQDKLSFFICTNYCQFCDNSKCNISAIQKKYQNNELTAKQMIEVKEFELDRVNCKNYIPNHEFIMFDHKILVHYLSGLTDEINGWFSTKEISMLWSDNQNIDYIEILFSDM